MWELFFKVVKRLRMEDKYFIDVNPPPNGSFSFFGVIYNTLLHSFVVNLDGHNVPLPIMYPYLGQSGEEPMLDVGRLRWLYLGSLCCMEHSIEDTWFDIKPPWCV